MPGRERAKLPQITVDAADDLRERLLLVTPECIGQALAAKFFPGGITGFINPVSIKSQKITRSHHHPPLIQNGVK